MSEPRRPGRLRTTLRILNVRLRFILLMVVTGLVAAQWDQIAARWERLTRPRAVAGEAGTVEHYCPMHPSVVRAEPANCPICGMHLSRRAKGEAAALPAGVVARVALGPQRVALAGIAVAEVAYRDLAREIRAVGAIAPDERRVARIAARVAGRIERLHVSSAGERVAAGAPIVDLYSPDLASAQQEYLTARARAAAPGADSTARWLVDAARERMRLWGLTDDQILALERRGVVRPTLAVLAPLGGQVTRLAARVGQYVSQGTELCAVADLARLWAEVQVDETDLFEVRAGQRVSILTVGTAGPPIEGTVRFVEPAIDPDTRRALVRVEVANDGLELLPGAYVEARIRVGEAVAPAGADRVKYICSMCPEVAEAAPGRCPTCGMNLVRVEAPAGGGVLAVPESAIVDTGARRLVYLEREPGVFDAVAVEVGPPSGGFREVRAGLAPGDRVVTQGAFLVDAEVRLNPAAAGSYFGASGGPGTSAGRER
jgi:Cu(I)/Ag(I) efflux system membrane fusion protein